VGGVAEQERPSDPEPRRQPRAERVGGAADEFEPVEVAAPGPWSEQPPERPGVGQVGLVLAVAQLELPPVPVPGDVHEGGGAVRVADLLDPVPGVQGAGDAGVDNQPAFGEPQVPHGHAEQAPDGAVGAVAAEHQTTGEGLAGAVPNEAGTYPHRSPTERVFDAVDPVDLHTAPEVDQRVPVDLVEQQRLQVGLVEHVGRGEAVVTGPDVAAELGHHPVPGVEQAQPAAGPGAGQEGVADADAVQGTGNLVVEVDGAG
jgi:hypothetical protein